MGNESERYPSSILIVDDDELVRNSLASSLKKIGIKKIASFGTGTQAWEAATKERFKMVMMDWQLQDDLSGIALFNRLRNHKHYRQVPILVITGYVGKENLNILEEFPFSHCIEKPFQYPKLISTVELALRESEWYRVQEEKLGRLVADVKAAKENAFTELIQFLEKSPSHKMVVTAGKFLKDHGFLNEAEKLFKLALGKKDSSLMALNELGKLYLEQGDLYQSKMVLEKAQKLSIGNIERLCNLGKISLEELDIGAADDYFQKAKDIDAHNHKAQSGEKLVANIKEYMAAQSSIPKSLSSLLNTIGISMVKSKKVAKGIEHYNAALMHVNTPAIQAKLAFNIGYAYKRDGEDALASEWFFKALRYDPDYDKVKKYMSPLEIAEAIEMNQEEEAEMSLDGDEPFESKNSSEPDLEGDEEQKEISKAEFIKLCPPLAQYLDNAAAAGIYLEPKLPEFFELYLKYGDQLFTQMINKSIAIDNLSFNQFKSMFNDTDEI